MNSCVRGVCVATLGVLTLALPCRAAGPNHGVGRAGIGGGLGLSTFRFDRGMGSNWFGDYSAGAIPRFSFGGHFRYVAMPWLRVQFSPGMTWTAYKGDEPVPFPDPRFPDDQFKTHYITDIVPMSVQAQYVYQRGQFIYHAGAGPGLYRVWVQNNREVLKDAITLRLHRGLYWGVSGELGAEYFLTQLPSTSVELSLISDLAFTTRDEQFPAGYNSHMMAMSLRVGVSYYFTPGEPKKKEETPTVRP
jgi:hypothetical protein